MKLATLALAGLSAVASSSVLAGKMTVDTNGGLEVFRSDNSDYWFKIGGRLHLDQAFIEGGETDRSAYPSGSQIRRARITFKGGVGNKWVYKLDVDHFDRASRFAGSPYPIGNPGFAEFGEAFIAYTGCPNVWAALGQISVPYSLEGWQSANDTAFMEVALPVEAFSRDTTGLGVYAEWHGDMFTLAGAVYQPKAGTPQIGDFYIPGVAGVGDASIGPNGSDPGSDPLGVGARLTFSPVHTDQNTYHLGLHGRYQQLHDHANFLQFYTPTEIRSRQSAWLTTNIPLRSVKNYQIVGFELAGQWDSVILSGEYIHAKAEREGNFTLVSDGTGVPPGLMTDPRSPGGDQKFYGYYVAASWVLTGEKKDYDFATGTFGRVRPKSSKGAWELGARHSYVKLVDDQQMASMPFSSENPQNPNNPIGAENSTTVGLTWWVNNNVRFLLNYAHANLPNTTDLNLLGFRGQVNW